MFLSASSRNRGHCTGNAVEGTMMADEPARVLPPLLAIPKWCELHSRRYYKNQKDAHARDTFLTPPYMDKLVSLVDRVRLFLPLSLFLFLSVCPSHTLSLSLSLSLSFPLSVSLFLALSLALFLLCSLSLSLSCSFFLSLSFRFSLPLSVSCSLYLSLSFSLSLSLSRVHLFGFVGCAHWFVWCVVSRAWRVSTRKD